jgi:pimeloyl-ACP methyl ester carboxylesterase
VGFVKNTAFSTPYHFKIMAMTPILYLHGFASGPSSSKARRFRDALTAAGAAVTVPDLAAGDFERLAISGQLGTIEQLAGDRPTALVGSSMGGYLAALFAARRPSVERLVLLAPAFSFAKRWPEKLGAAEMDRWRRTDALEVFHYAEGRNRVLRYRLMEDAAQYEDFPDFRQPALIFHGRRDDIVPVEYSQEFAVGRSNVTLEVVDSGHDLLDVLDAIVPRAVAFLTQ